MRQYHSKQRERKHDERREKDDKVRESGEGRVSELSDVGGKTKLQQGELYASESEQQSRQRRKTHHHTARQTHRYQSLVRLQASFFVVMHVKDAGYSDEEEEPQR